MKSGFWKFSNFNGDLLCDILSPFFVIEIKKLCTYFYIKISRFHNFLFPSYLFLTIFFINTEYLLICPLMFFLLFFSLFNLNVLYFIHLACNNKHHRYYWTLSSLFNIYCTCCYNNITKVDHANKKCKGMKKQG